MKAALLVESLTGNTWRAAEAIASNLSAEGWSITGMSKVRRPDLASVQQADVVLVGTWTHGLFLFGQAPWAAGDIANLPTMRDKRVAYFMTYALEAGRSLEKLGDSVAATGADVIGGLLIKRNHIAAHAEAFAERLVGAVERS
ncbi:MAG: flavodoxin family protein [Ilumatobacteraceae bacterium]|nr:hypothetical protein [Actinomycetota bacterium]